MGKFSVCLLLCALFLCNCFKKSKPFQPLNCIVRARIDDPDPTLRLQFNDDGVIQMEDHQALQFRIESKCAPDISFSPNLDAWRLRSHVRNTDIYHTTAYISIFQVSLRKNESGWIDVRDCDNNNNWVTNGSSRTAFFTKDKTGKKFVESGYTLKMRETAARNLVPCRGTSGNVLPKLRIISPIHLVGDYHESEYDPKFGFLLPEQDGSRFLARTFECVTDEEKVIVAFPKIEVDPDNRPQIRINDVLNIPECFVKNPTRIIAGSSMCSDLQRCNLNRPPVYENYPYFNGWKASECLNCTNISVSESWGPKPMFPGFSIICYANGQVASGEVIRGLNGIYYFADKIQAKETMQRKNISRRGSEITVGIKFLDNMYFSDSDAFIVFKNGSKQAILASQVERYAKDGIANMDVTVSWTEDMQRIDFYLDQQNFLNTLSVDLRSAGNLPDEYQCA